MDAAEAGQFVGRYIVPFVVGWWLVDKGIKKWRGRK